MRICNDCKYQITLTGPFARLLLLLILSAAIIQTAGCSRYNPGGSDVER